jgi:SPP1 gp7 family putative phage head morphogenesis protein
MERLSDTEEIRKIESRLANLISRTFLKGAVGVPGPQIEDSVKRAFGSKGYEIQLDKIIDDIYYASVAWADNKAGELEPSRTAASKTAAKLLQQNSKVTAAKLLQQNSKVTAAKDKPLPITEEAIKQTKALSGDAAESVTRWLKDNDLYTQHPDQLARQVKDLWDGERYKARRFAVTFTADLAENTAIHRYAALGITYLQFYAEIDDRTTPQCRQFHGTIIKSNSLDAQRYRPPLHHHCRSCLIPATSKTLEDKELLIENRDFTQHFSQDFTPLKMRTDIEQVNGVLEEIGKFNEKYRIDQFILDEDIQLRLMKLNLSVVSKFPEVKPGLDKWLKEPEKVEPVKPKYTPPDEIRGKIVDNKAAFQQKREDLIKQIEDLKKQGAADWEEYETLNDRLYGKESPTKYYKTLKEKQEAEARLNELESKVLEHEEKVTELKAIQKGLRKEETKAARELFYINDGTPRAGLYSKPDPYLEYGREYKPETIKRIKEAEEFLNKTTSQAVRDQLPDLRVWEVPYRSNAGHNLIIELDEAGDTGTLIHETGHMLEFTNPEIQKSAQDYLARRTAGEKEITLNEFHGTNSYKNDEICKPDKFISPYIGKIYEGGDTEVISMGIAYLY